MEHFRSSVHHDDLARDYRYMLERELAAIPEGSGRGRGGLPDGWINGLKMQRFKPERLPLAFAVEIKDLLAQVPNEGVVQIMVNALPPSGNLGIHVDGKPYHARYHLPFITDPANLFWTEQDGTFHMAKGYWYGPVEYWKPHAVQKTVSERVHLVVDIATPNSVY